MLNRLDRHGQMFDERRPVPAECGRQRGEVRQGMSFGRWRQQLQLMLAVKWLGTGASVQQVADRLGYESAGSFVTMFRKALGTSPGRYIGHQRS